MEQQKKHTAPSCLNQGEFFFLYGMDGKAEECGGPHLKLNIPVFPGIVPSTALFPNSSGAISQYAFSKGNNFSAHIGSHCSTWSCTNHGFKTSFPAGREKRQTRPTPTFPKHGTRRESHWKQLMGMEISAQLPSQIIKSFSEEWLG